jgi:glyoxylase-like metal-dependent hydrolase (beta-lactamase superfamily II)
MSLDSQSTTTSERPRSTVDALYVAVSAQKQLPPGAKIADLFELNTTRPYFVQRLTERTYCFGGGFYTTTFYVGDEGVLVLDPPDNQGANLLQAIADVTELPVTAIVYSHNHADHLLSAPQLVEAAKNAGVNDVRVIASTATDEKMQLLGTTLQRPTEKLSWPTDAFQFEDLTVEMHGFVRAAHTDDAAIWLLVEEEVAHLPDLVNGDQPPFRRFSESENFAYFRGNVNQLGSLDWVHLVGGHGNVASKDDIRYYNVYIDDLEVAVERAMQSTHFADVVELDGKNNHAALMMPWLEAVVTGATDAMRPKYGQHYGFEITVPTNAEMVMMAKISYR